jgi:hypothetical protein
MSGQIRPLRAKALAKFESWVIGLRIKSLYGKLRSHSSRNRLVAICRLIVSAALVREMTAPLQSIARITPAAVPGAPGRTPARPFLVRTRPSRWSSCWGTTITPTPTPWMDWTTRDSPMCPRTSSLVKHLLRPGIWSSRGGQLGSHRTPYPHANPGIIRHLSLIAQTPCRRVTSLGSTPGYLGR